MERIYTIADFTEEDAKYLQSRVEIWADQFNRHAEYIGLKDRAHVGMDIHKMPQVEWDYGYIYTLDPFGEKWEIKFGDNKYKVPKLKVVDKLYSLMDSMVGYKYSSKSKQKTKGESMKHTCSMQKKKESLLKKSEAAGQDMQLHLWFPRYSNASKKVYLYVVKPSDFEGWYDVSNEYHDAYEKNAELRNGDVDYEKVRYDVMKQILSGAVKPCEDPMNSHRNFTSLFDSRPYVITQYKQDSLDSKYDECKSEAKKPTCSMSKKKESLVKKNEANSEEYITEWQADIIKGLEKVKDKYGLVIEYNGPFSDQWKEYPTYSVFVRKGGKKEDIGTVGTDYVHAFVDYTSPGMNVSSPHYAKDYSAEEAIQAILNSANMCLGKKGESKKSEGASDTIKVTDENVMLTVNDVYVDDHGGSFSVETPEEGKSYNLLEMQEMIRGMCEDCTGYANYSRDGSELLIEVMAGEMDDNGEWTGDYYTAYSFRCIARIMSYSLEGIIDFLDESN